MAKNALAICLLFLVASSVIYEVQGTFLLKMYLRRKLFPRRCGDFTPFACKGMLRLMGALQGGCPATREFKTFFLLFRSYIKFILSVTVASKSVDTEMSTKCEGLAKAMALLSGGVEASSDFKDTMFSMGKILVEQKMSGSIIMRRAQRRELVVSMVRWTKMVVTLVTAASEKKGKTIDVSSLGLDVDVNSSVGSGDDESDDESPSSGSPSPKTETPNSGSSSTEDESPSSGSASSGSASSSRSGSSSRAASGSTSKDTSGGSPTEESASPSVPTPSVPTPSVPSGSAPSDDSGETAEKGTASGSGESSTKTKQSSTGSTKTRSENANSEASGETSGSESGSPSGSVPSPSVPSGSESGESSVKGSASGSGETSTKSKSQGTSTSSETTSVKQVETETSKEVMSFISSLEEKYAGKAELKVFFDKLKSSMSASSKLSATDSKDFISGMKSAAGKLYQAMSFVRSKFDKSEEMKTEMETRQAQFMQTLKELQDIKSQIVSQSQGKTVTSTQQTELKQTLVKWEQVTTQYVETAASSSSSSSQSQQSSATTNTEAS